MSDYKKNILAGILFILFGLALLLYIPNSINDDGMSILGPRAFPNLIAYGIILLSLSLLITNIYKLFSDKKKETKTKDSNTTVLDEVRVLLLTLIMLLYVLTFEPLGYFISTFISSTLILALFKVKKWYLYAIIYTIAGLIYLAFTKLLFVILP